MTQSNSHQLKIIFAGTPEFSVAPLQALLASTHQVVAVYTQPDRPAGRGRKITASPVKQVALEHNIPVLQPESLKPAEAQAQLAQFQADIMVVVAYGLILPKAVLETPKYGCLNIHASLLPRWRGAAPIQRAIESGDAQSGVTIMQMDVGLDTGAMLYKVETPIAQEDTAQNLHDRLSSLGAKALIRTLEELPKLQANAQSQTESEVTYAQKLTKAEAQIDWNLPAGKIAQKIQAFNPWPVAFCEFHGKTLRVWRAKAANSADIATYTKNTPAGEVLQLDQSGLYVATGDGVICLEQVQPAGKKTMSAYDFAQARKPVGSKLK